MNPVGNKENEARILTKQQQKHIKNTKIETLRHPSTHACPLSTLALPETVSHNATRKK